MSMRFGTLLVIVCFVVSCFFIRPVSSAEDPDSLVDATFNISFISGTDVLVDVEMNAYKLTTDHVYTAAEIASASDEERGALKHAIYLLLKNQLNTVFRGADIQNFELPKYSNGVFHEELNVKLNSAFFGINNSIDVDQIVNGALDIGAVITYAFDLVTEPGWNNTFTCVLPESISLRSVNTNQTSQDLKEATWAVSWCKEESVTSAVLSTQFTTPTTESETEDIFLSFDVDTSNVDNVSLTTIFSVNTIDIQAYDLLPDFISELEYIPSDGVRLFVDNGLLSWDELYQNTMEPLEQLTISTLERSSLNQTLAMSFNWDPETSTNCTSPYNITEMDATPEIKAELTSQSPINLLFCDISSRAFFGLVNAGAIANISKEDINFGDSLDEIGRPYEVFLNFPSDVYLEEKNRYRWNESVQISGVFSSAVQPMPQYSEEKIENYIEIDTRKLDLNIPSFFTGQSEFTSSVYLKEDIHIFVTSFPEEFSLSDKIMLPFLNSDAFRVCVDESVFSQDEVDRYLSAKKDVFESRLSGILHDLEIKGIIDREVFSDSLSWNKDISQMDDVKPIIASTYANNLYPVRFSFSVLPPSIEIANQSFTFTSRINQSTTYRLLFPKGISVTATDMSNKSLTKGETVDGKEYIEVFFESDDEVKSLTVTCMLVASPLFMLGQFLPCIISFILVIILIIIVYIFRRKRKGRKIIIKEKAGDSSYEGEDFYVPPPPS